MKTLNKVEFTCRGFPYIRIKDRYDSDIRVQQSSACLSDIWLFIDEEAVVTPGGPHAILLTEENIKDIKRFKKFLRDNNYC